jgi:hypothetical protein
MSQGRELPLAAAAPVETVELGDDDPRGEDAPRTWHAIRVRSPNI